MPISRLYRLKNSEPERYRSYHGVSMNPIWVIIAINFLLFILTLIAREVIYSYLGLIPAIFWERPWTIVTNMFVHAGFGHIFSNMLVLFFFGRFLTMLVGQRRFLWVYFSGGILGSIFYIFFAFLGDSLSIGFLGTSISIAIGASGAVSAIAGALVMMMPNLRVYLYFIVPMPLWIFVILFLVIFSFIPGLNIAWQAHIGGLVAGLIAGYFFRRKGRYYYY